MTNKLEQRAVCPSCGAEHCSWDCMDLKLNQYFCPETGVRLSKFRFVSLSTLQDYSHPFRWEIFEGKEGQK